jgi:hypothetical protein
MKYLQKLRLIFTYYRNLIWVSIFIDLACIFILWKNGIDTYSALFWFKLFTLGVSVYFTNEYRKDEYFYFYNFGLSKKSSLDLNYYSRYTDIFRINDVILQS